MHWHNRGPCFLPLWKVSYPLPVPGAFESVSSVTAMIPQLLPVGATQCAHEQQLSMSGIQI